MPDFTVDASLTEWEDGVDLVLSMSLPVSAGTIWPHLTEPGLVDTWFAGFERLPDSDADEGTGDGDDGTRLAFTFDDESVDAELLSIARPEESDEGGHILVDMDGIGRLSIVLRSENEGAGTRVSLAHTVAGTDVEGAEIASVVEQVGPVWETHLRLLAASLAGESGLQGMSYDIPEAVLIERYVQLAGDFA